MVLFSIPKTYEGNGTYISTFQLNSTIIINCLSESGSALDSGEIEMNQLKVEREINVTRAVKKMCMYITAELQRRESSIILEKGYRIFCINPI